MRRAGVIALVCLAAGASTAPAQDNSAPLSNSRQQLQALKKDQAAEKSGANESSLKGAASSSDVRNNLNLTAPQTGQERDKEKKVEKRNWLIDGYDKLDPKSARNREREKTEDEKPLDPKDPEYFLRLYERQRAATDAKRAEQERNNGTESEETARNAKADPFTPFLSTWLAGSPVKDVLQETLRGSDKRSGASEATRTDAANERTKAASDALSATTILSDLSGKPHSATDSAASNPFVQALGLNGSANDAALRQVPAPAVNPPATPPKTNEFTLPLPPRITAPARPASVPDENQKFFPQLKKF